MLFRYQCLIDRRMTLVIKIGTLVTAFRKSHQLLFRGLLIGLCRKVRQSVFLTQASDLLESLRLVGDDVVASDGRLAILLSLDGALVLLLLFHRIHFEVIWVLVFLLPNLGERPTKLESLLNIVLLHLVHLVDDVDHLALRLEEFIIDEFVQ